MERASIEFATRDPVAALQHLVIALTPEVEQRGFEFEASGEAWAHWVDRDDPRIVLRAYAYATEGGGISFTVTGAPMRSALSEHFLESVPRLLAER
jgi:hypothetical protein